MVKRKIFIVFIISFVNVLLACATTSHKYTYMNTMNPTDPRDEIFWPYIVPYMIIKNINDENIFRIRFEIVPRTVVYKCARYIYREPYDLRISFAGIGNRSFTINSIKFHTERGSTEIRNDMQLYIRYRYWTGRGINNFYTEILATEQENSLFINTGIINVSPVQSGINAREETFIGPLLVYENIDVNYRNDKKFSIELDISYEREEEIFNTILEVPFEREHVKAREKDRMNIATIWFYIKLYTVGFLYILF
ncbi:MAG: hypothetical protein LBH44_05105 [Treponema sp.]|nr:hypothetical protein [Treponema sp.]